MWYCVTVVVGGGMAVMIAWWNVWILSDSLCSPQAHWVSCLLVTSMPRALWSDQSSGSVCMSALMVWSDVWSASMSWEIVCGCCRRLGSEGGGMGVFQGRSVCEYVWWGSGRGGLSGGVRDVDCTCVCAVDSCGHLLWLCLCMCLRGGSLGRM